jgi:hypothetical protein
MLMVVACSAAGVAISANAQTAPQPAVAPLQQARLVMPVVAAAPAALPDAPQPEAAKDAQPPDPEYTVLLSSSKSKYSTVLKPGQTRVPYTAKEKFIFAVRESVSPEQAFVVTLGAGYNQLINGNPHYGTDSNGFGEREGTSALREASNHLLGDGLFASAFHQDPRYFRDGNGVPFKARAKHVLVSAVTSHADSDGHLQPDYSGLLGRASTAAMTVTYYPHVSATPDIAAETFGYSILGELAGNAFLEFWPDIIHRHQKDQ